jgi:hypothetical protein
VPQVLVEDAQVNGRGRQSGLWQQLCRMDFATSGRSCRNIRSTQLVVRIFLH